MFAPFNTAAGEFPANLKTYALLSLLGRFGGTELL
jgi:hypothetical protein